MSINADVEKKELKKLEPAPVIPIEQLRAHLSRFRHITTETDQSWINYVGDGSGSGLILLLVIGGIMCWCCTKPGYDLSRPPVFVTYTAPKIQSMMQTREADQYSALGQKTAGFQDPVSHRNMVQENDMQPAFATAL